MGNTYNNGLPFSAPNPLFGLSKLSVWWLRLGICIKKNKVNLSHVFAGQDVGMKETDDGIWLVTFMDYDLGYFDLETNKLEPLEYPFAPEVVQPISPVQTVTYVSGTDRRKMGSLA